MNISKLEFVFGLSALGTEKTYSTIIVFDWEIMINRIHRLWCIFEIGFCVDHTIKNVDFDGIVVVFLRTICSIDTIISISNSCLTAVNLIHKIMMIC